MTTYITHLDELQKLAKGEIKVEDIAKPENISILSWSGVDVITMFGKEAEDDVTEMIDKMGGVEMFEQMINNFIKRLDGLSCGDCIQWAVNDFVRDGEC